MCKLPMYLCCMRRNLSVCAIFDAGGKLDTMMGFFSLYLVDWVSLRLQCRFLTFRDQAMGGFCSRQAHKMFIMPCTRSKIFGGDKYNLFTILNIGRTCKANCRLAIYYINTIFPLFSFSFTFSFFFLSFFPSSFLFRPRSAKPPA